jgi:hypothetical protein
MMLVLFDGMITLETFLFVEWHFAELVYVVTHFFSCEGHKCSTFLQNISITDENIDF